MVLKIRKGTITDEPALTHICLVTGDSGRSAESLMKNKELPSVIFAAPYVHMSSAYCFVLVDIDEGAVSTTSETEGTVVGYIVGTTNCRAYEKEAAENWWPKMHAKYPQPPESDKEQYSDLELFFYRIMSHPHITPQAVLDIYQAYLHINILEPYRGKGWGSKLIRAAAEGVKNDGGKGLWLRLNPNNKASQKFYTALGFKNILTIEGEFHGLDGIFYGLDVEKYLSSGKGQDPVGGV